jgi:hypothetical protein
MARNRGRPMQIVWGALLCAVAAAAAHAEEFEVNYKLGGVTSVRYRMYLELMFGKPETNCKIDPAEWDAAMDRVASHSTKLRFVSQQAEFEEDAKRRQKEENEGKCHLDLKNHDDGLPFCSGPQEEPMPSLDFFVTAAKVENTCLAEVAALGSLLAELRQHHHYRRLRDIPVILRISAQEDGRNDRRNDR